MTMLRYNWPYMYISLSTLDFGWHMEVAGPEATEEMIAVASFPQAP